MNTDYPTSRFLARKHGVFSDVTGLGLLPYEGKPLSHAWFCENYRLSTMFFSFRKRFGYDIFLYFEADPTPEVKNNVLLAELGLEIQAGNWTQAGLSYSYRVAFPCLDKADRAYWLFGRLGISVVYACVVTGSKFRRFWAWAFTTFLANHALSLTFVGICVFIITCLS